MAMRDRAYKRMSARTKTLKAKSKILGADPKTKAILAIF
jgi:hypothetical protein